MILTNQIINATKFILFLCKISFIFATEGVLYAILRNYSLLIERLTTRLSSINILYVKIFQAFALNNRLINEDLNNQLLKFTDNAPWNYSDINLYELIELADKYNINLEHGYETPINAGMISLVFKGSQRHDNKTVIIKMKRRNIQQKLDDAIDNLLYLMYILSFIPIINNYQLAEVIEKNIEIIRHQTNFLEEVDNMNMVRENCKNLKYIKIPVANRSVTEDYPNMILMEYIDGLKVDQISECDYEGFAKQVIKFGIVTTIIHGLTHGDLHSGNILFIKDLKDDKYPYKLGIIDFGIVYKVSTEYKNLLFDIFTNLFDTEPLESAKKILNSGIIDPPGILKSLPKDQYNEIIQFTEEIIKDTLYASKQANQVQIYKFISKLKEYLSKKELTRLGIRPSDDFVKSQLVLAMAHGVTLTLCKEDFIILMDKVLNELFNTNLLL